MHGKQIKTLEQKLDWNTFPPLVDIWKMTDSLCRDYFIKLSYWKWEILSIDVMKAAMELKLTKYLCLIIIILKKEFKEKLALIYNIEIQLQWEGVLEVGIKILIMCSR